MLYRRQVHSLAKTGSTQLQGDITLTEGSNITITQSAQDLSIASTGGGMSIGGTVTSGTAGSVLFVNAGPVLAQDNANFFWDDTNNRLGLGTVVPSAMFTISGATGFLAPISGATSHYIGVNGAPLRVQYETNNSASSSGTLLVGRRSRGTAAVPLAVAADDTLFSISANGYATTGYPAASVTTFAMKAANDFTDTSAGTYYSLFTTPVGSLTAVECMRVQQGLSVKPTSPINNPPYAEVFDEATTNLVVNPSFEVNVTDGWSLTGSNGTKTRVTTEKYTGDASLQLVISPATANSGIVSSAMPVTASLTYVFSVFLKGNSGGEIIRIGATGNVSGSSLATVILTTSWNRFWYFKTMGASDTTATVTLFTDTATAPTFYVDGAMFEQKTTTSGENALPTSYADGSMGVNYSWSGTAHNSASSRLSGLSIIAPIVANSCNPGILRTEGSEIAVRKRITIEGGMSLSGGSTDNFSWEVKGYKPSLAALAGTEGLGRFNNTGNGVALWVKSAATSEFGMIVEGPNMTTGAVFAVAAPTSLTNFSGSYLRFFDKSNKDMFTVKRDSMTYGNVALGWTKTLNKYSGGKYSETSGANLTGTTAWSGTALTGTGTSYTTELVVGDVLTFTGSTQIAVVEAIASNTAATVTAAANPALTTVAYQKRPTQAGMFRTFIEGPDGDHVGIAKGDVTSCFFLTEADQLRLKGTAFTAGTGTISLTAASGNVTTGSANAGLAVGDWIHVQGNSTSALGNEPLQVIRVVSTTSFQVRPAATTTQATISGWTYQKGNQMTVPTDDDDGFGVVMNNFRDQADAGPSATTNETSLFATTFRVRGGTISTNRMLRITAHGTLSGANAGKTLTLKIKLGTTTILTTHAEVIADASTNNWFMEARICSVNSLSSQRNSLMFTCQSPTTSVTDHILDVETSSVNMAADQDLDITATWGVAASTLTANYKLVEVV